LKHTLESFKKVGTNKNLLFLVLFHATLAVVLKISLWFYQPYMLKAGIPMLYFGIAWASLNIFSIAGSKLAHRVEGFLGVNRSLWLIILLSTLSLAFMSYWIVLFGMIFIFAQQFARGFAPPVVLDYTNKHLSSEKRATLLSIQSFAGGLSFAIFAPLYGWIADAYSLSTALIATAASFLVIFIILMIWKKTLDKKKGG
jgi:MFS family permease